MTRIQLLCAFQALATPSIAPGAGKAARATIKGILGLDDLPSHPPQPQDSVESYLSAWLGLELA